MVSEAEIFLVVIVLKIRFFYCQDYNTSHESDCLLMAVVANHTTTELSDKKTVSSVGHTSIFIALHSVWLMILSWEVGLVVFIIVGLFYYSFLLSKLINAAMPAIIATPIRTSEVESTLFF